jgi:D-alanine-D-alanine ligase
MPNLTVAFLYNVRHRYPDPSDPASQLETDFDDPTTIEAIGSHLRAIGYEIIPIEANEDAYLSLRSRREEIDVALNYAMGIHGAARYAQIPAMLEMLRIPYTGSDPLTQALVLDKSRMQETLAAHGVSVLPSQLFHSDCVVLRSDLSFPLIVKPVAQGSSAGITGESVVRDGDSLRRQVARVVETFREPALVQPFLEGREFSVPMLGNPPRVFPLIEPEFSRLPEGYAHLDSLEVKWVYEDQVEEHHLRCPAEVDPTLEALVANTARGAWDALGVRDWCRIDIRCDAHGCPFVLDVNSPAGLIPPEVSMTSYFPLAARAAGVDYQGLLSRIVETALARYPVRSSRPRSP